MTAFFEGLMRGGGTGAGEAGALLARERGKPECDASCKYSAAPRICELVEAGFVRDSGKRRARSIVWVVADGGDT